MLSRSKVVSAIAVAAGVVAFWSLAGAEPAAEMSQGDIQLDSVGALEFGPRNILFVGDSEGAQIVAMEVDIPSANGTAFEAIADLDGKIAAMLGVGSRDVFIKDMVVHEGSGSTFLSVMRGSGDDAQPVLLSIARDGEIAEVSTRGVRHSALSLGDAPGMDSKVYNHRSRTLTITDLEFIDGELYIAGLSNEEFASKLRRAAFPFNGEVDSTGLEIYHGAHGEYETFAPIFSFIPYEIGGDEMLLAGYLCTPLVSFPMDDVKSKNRLRGKTLAELGWGNTVIDMIDYEFDGERFLLVANNRRGTMKMKATDIAAAQKGTGITSEVGPRTGVDYHTVPLGNVAQIADLDADNILVLGRAMDNGALALSVRSKRWI